MVNSFTGDSLEMHMHRMPDMIWQSLSRFGIYDMDGNLTQYVFNYYGVDWLAMFMTFISIYLLGKKNKYGFIFGLLANASWLTFGIIVNSLGNVAANVVFTFLNIKGYLNWRRSEV